MKRISSSALDLTSLSPTAQAFVKAVEGTPDLATRLAKMACVFRKRGQKADAAELARAAKELAPDDFLVRALTEWTTRREAPLWHFMIVHDTRRNETYARALEHFVRPGMTVFEIGTGTGILAMLAARAGARHVYTCERRQEVAETAREIVERNGLGDRITVIPKDANELRLGIDLPDRADLFVAEIVDNGLLGEGVLNLTELARRRFLKPDAPLLPQAVSAVGCLVSGRGHHETYRVTTAMGFDLTPFNRFTPSEVPAGRGGGSGLEPLSEAVELVRFDLRADTSAYAEATASLPVCADGLAEGLLRWVRLDFGAGIAFENRPPLGSAWEPVLHVFPEAMAVSAGSRVDVKVLYERERIFVVPCSVPRDEKR